ncbi:hypothetical protein PHMEG_00012312, partial [Phytophthora megakarya]
DIPQIPDIFVLGFRNYRCIHGVMQKRRGEGVREVHLNFTDCRAQLDAVVTWVRSDDQGGAWCVLVWNEWRMHNHNADGCDHIRGMNDLPAEGPVADNIGVLADAGAGSRQIANYASNALGE